MLVITLQRFVLFSQTEVFQASIFYLIKSTFNMQYFKEQLQQICLFNKLLQNSFRRFNKKVPVRFSKECLLEHQRCDPSVFYLFAMGNDS